MGIGPTVGKWGAAWTLTAALAVLLAFAAIVTKDRSPPAPPADLPGTAELVATTETGVKVWKVTGPGLVVPYVFAESRTGSLSSR